VRISDWSSDVGSSDLDGRFDMVCLVLSLVLHRIDDDPGQAAAGVQLTELFVADMDGQIRQIGFGDMVVGKQIGRMVGALGGRLGAYRAADGSDELRQALVRNLWRGSRSEEHTSELQSLMRISYAVFCLKKKKRTQTKNKNTQKVK